MDVQKIAPIIEEILKKTLQQKKYPFGFGNFRGVGNKVASGKLKDSIKVTAQQSGDETIIQVLAENYSKWVQSGRLGHGRPIKKGEKGVPIFALEQWIKARGLKGRNKKGQFITNKSFAFAIRNNIFKFGIRQSNFLDVALDTLEADPRIMELLEGEAFEELLNIIEGI
jgi:hypothetical protein